MWKCGQCGAQNGDNSNFCTSCGQRREITGESPAPNTGAPSQLYGGARPRQSMSDYYVRTCREAQLLEMWGKILVVIGIVLGAIMLISSLFSAYSIADTYSYYLDSGAIFGAVFGGLISAGLCVLGGFLGKLVLSSFAIIVESHFRNLGSKEGK